jgi:hypothetical protein
MRRHWQLLTASGVATTAGTQADWRGHFSEGAYPVASGQRKM